MKSQLPKHLEDMLNKRNEEYKKFGIDPDWAVKAYQKAEKRGDHFNPIYALV